MNKATEKTYTIPKNFLLFLVASFLFWVLINLSKKYKTVLNFPVTYVNLPQNKLLEETPIKEIETVVEGTGFQILKSKLNKNSLKLDIGSLIKKENKEYVLSLKKKQVSIQNQLGNKLKIEGFLQENIFFKIVNLSSKKIGVKLNADLNFSPGYDLSEKIKIIPDSIIISGPKPVLDTITNLFTQKIKLSNITESIEKELAIKIPKNIPINVNKSLVSIYGKVEKFTEGSFIVDYQIVNNLDNVLVTTFPKKVKIVFKVGLSNFNKITATSFQVVCDLKVSQENNLSYLIPKLMLSSNLVKSVKIVPNKIEFLIQKQ